MSISLRNVFCVAAILLTGATAPPAVADIVIPDELQGQYGAQYHLVFVTSDTFFTAPSTDIAYYNTLVTNMAEHVDAITRDWGLEWKAIGSTENATAKANAVVSAPVYLIDGITKIAIGYYDMWDGSILAPIDVTEKRTRVGGAVFTGSDEYGVGKVNRLLGSGDAWLGTTALADKSWLDNGASNEGFGAYRHYALSPLLMVPVPEPTSVTLWLCVACVGLFFRVSARRKRCNCVSS